MLLTTFLGCMSHLPGWQEQPEQLRVLMRVREDQAELVPLQTSVWMEPHLVWGEGLGWDVATGHFGLFICFFPRFSILGALIFILACFRWCCTRSWDLSSCRHAILILGPNFRAFIPIWKNASVTEIDQNTTRDISTVYLHFIYITFHNPSVKY